MEEMENMRCRMAMHVISKPTFPIPNSLKVVECGCRSSGPVSLLQENRQLIACRGEGEVRN
jgi:hypothetical protein